MEKCRYWTFSFFHKTNLVSLVKKINMKYLKIKVKKGEIKYSKSQKLIIKIFSFLLPVANPDFEKVIDHVSEWLLEFEDEKTFQFEKLE
jgi:hypothetical protein